MPRSPFESPFWSLIYKMRILPNSSSSLLGYRPPLMHKELQPNIPACLVFSNLTLSYEAIHERVPDHVYWASAIFREVHITRCSKYCTFQRHQLGSGGALLIASPP